MGQCATKELRVYLNNNVIASNDIKNKHLEGKFDDLVYCIVVSILHHHGDQQLSHQQLSNEIKAHTLKFLTLKLNVLQQQCVM
jgi:hypothetical protein